ncbi:ParA family protein (plasmid) [Citricoccus sp. SGAir0253]|uniref:MinD/ParA family ATP-binding protein n=1 Tax=Citricoccus sp. SGAir0253 TaxID=2567881 RepID=UPI0010CCB28A|nr:chromosome partitioning protein ParA [Citricoccus sp. SGAir0253]QCU79706.1 ParA family protein [Citricoccus sp. SGAir0253]
MTSEPAAWPKLRAIIREDGTGELTINGTSRPVDGTDSTQTRRHIINQAHQLAIQHGRPVALRAAEGDREYSLVIDVNGSVEEMPTDNARPIITTPPTPAKTTPTPPRQESTPIPNLRNSAPEPPQTSSEELPSLPARASLRETTFLVPDQTTEPAGKGWRAALNRLGLAVPPSAAELAEREDVRTVSQHWPGPRTVAVVNRKGGANKTPTVALLAAVLARYGGGPVLAWDNNESQGTLGWRTEQGPHTASVLDLVDSSTRLLSPETSTADLAHFVHHQPADKYDVLHSDGNDEGDHEVTAEEVDIAHQVASRFYRMIIMDSGNTARSANWRRMIDHTDQLVVPVTAMEDRAEAALLTLQTLESRGGHDADLARGAVVIVSESTDAARGLGGDALKRARAEAARIAEGFTPLVRAVVRVPYDPALVRGTIRYDDLRPGTQRAWLGAAAAVAQGF